MINIAIDGPSSAGKSSLSKRIANEFSFIHVDTGALYRAVALHIVRNGADPSKAEEVVPLLSSLKIDVKYDDKRVQHVFVNGEEVCDADLRK